MSLHQPSERRVAEETLWCLFPPLDAGAYRTQMFRDVSVSNLVGGNDRVSALRGLPGDHDGQYGGAVNCIGWASPCSQRTDWQRWLLSCFSGGYRFLLIRWHDTNVGRNWTSNAVTLPIERYSHKRHLVSKTTIGTIVVLLSDHSAEQEKLRAVSSLRSTRKNGLSLVLAAPRNATGGGDRSIIWGHRKLVTVEGE